MSGKVKFNISDSWVTACPEVFRDEIQRHLNNPPGSPGAESVYGYTFLDEYTMPTFHCLEDGTIIGEKNSDRMRCELRRKFAQAWGVYAESMVCCWLLERGFPIREKDWRPKGGAKPLQGEIDIITQRGNRIIFVEVKARCGKYSDPWDAIDAKKRARLCRGADMYLKMQKEVFEYQFDVALITGNYLDMELEYIEDAFMAPLRIR